MKKCLLGLVWLFIPLVVMAEIELRTFSTPAQEQLYNTLTNELRCLVCQNQNLADSNAELAQDLRQKTYEMVSGGASHADIVSFMVSRYGDFVLYRPPVQQNTWLLWLGPGLFLLLGLVIVVRVIRKQGQGGTA